MIPLIPLAIAALGFGAFHAVKRREAQIAGEGDIGLTPERAILYQTALNPPPGTPRLSPEQLRTLAASFRKANLGPQADMLEKRAKLRALPKEIQEERRAIFRKAMASTNVAAIRTVADVFDTDGATGAADALRTYAEGLAATPDVSPISEAAE